MDMRILGPSSTRLRLEQEVVTDHDGLTAHILQEFLQPISLKSEHHAYFIIVGRI